MVMNTGGEDSQILVGPLSGVTSGWATALALA